MLIQRPVEANFLISSIILPSLAVNLNSWKRWIQEAGKEEVLIIQTEGEEQ